MLSCVTLGVFITVEEVVPLFPHSNETPNNNTLWNLVKSHTATLAAGPGHARTILHSC